MRYAMIFALVLFASLAVAKSYTVEDLQGYTRDEIEAMGNKDIQLQIAYWEWQKAEADAVVEEWEPQVLPLRAERDELLAIRNQLQQDINWLRGEINRLRNSGVNHTIVEGESLWLIASYHYYFGNGSEWPRIYERNSAHISDPNMIYAGDTIVVPVPMASTYTVVEGDFLGKIAGYGIVYNNRGEWPQLYEANRDQISNPNLIYPGQVLDIPRGGMRGGR
ncbi:MAG TPA: LysM peptidoglycan-binding domain-containing protein [Candidatus Sabulitectum sp.]|nr:LysM peptidoglycan-binding domain-containing protein [Candidatus Sabulitectum sp.]HPF31376.1 LysM peptidoglycan-binding domain-containing protein [Candidatus Sabulitectum sp.]HPJ27450.1 LysM peptidoglycan-binding domain-containing protein [Candidatus Sabulitectum sp.]HPR21325.1 LysM peptidoglycan-binding domain-containing protein [Candidatus Sabulitectum sp.]